MHNNPLLWEQGLFLQPQHFQLEHRHLQQNLAQAYALLHPWLWGIRALEVNDIALNTQMLEITRLDMRCPDGTLATFPGNATLAPRSFREVWTTPECPLMVYAGLAPFREEGGNAFGTDDPESAPAHCRYTAPLEPEQIPDLYGGGPAADVRTMRLRLRLLFNDEGAGENVLRIPLLRLKLEGARVLADSAYIPPCLELGASPLLQRMARDVRDTLLARCKQLEEYKVTPSDSSFSAISSMQGMTLFSILGVLSRNAPELEQWLEAPHAHPWQIYLLLCRLVGELSVFSSGLSPLGESTQGGRALPLYDHEALFDCFQAARDIIVRLVNTLVIGPAYTFILENNNGILRTTLPQEACAPGYAYWLLLRSQHTDALHDSITQLAKLAPESMLHTVVTQALPGVRMRKEEQPPAGLPRRKDTVYLRIDTGDTLWQQILSSRTLAFTLPESPDDLLAQLTLIQG